MTERSIALPPWTHVTPALLERIRAGYRLDWHGIHGLPHWRRVLENGRELAEATGADLAVVEYFAAFHDSRRFNDDRDPDHGARGGALARRLAAESPGWVRLDASQLEVLVEACRTHTSGTHTHDPTIGTCWDADRLDLLRVGIRPDPRHLVTAAARDPAVLARAMERSA